MILAARITANFNEIKCSFRVFGILSKQVADNTKRNVVPTFPDV